MQHKGFQVLNNFACFQFRKIGLQNRINTWGENECKTLTRGLFNARCHCELVHVWEAWETLALL